MRILVTRPEGEAERTAAALRERGHEVVLAPLLRIEPIIDPELGAGPWSAALFTAANAVRAIVAHRRFAELSGLPAYVVGRQTGAVAAEAGFSPIFSADGTVGDLIALVAAKRPTAAGPLIYLAGEERAGDLTEALRPLRVQVETAIVYRARMAEVFEPAVRDLLAGGHINAVLHYSPRSALAFLTALMAAGIDDSSIHIRHLCISSAVAAPLIAARAASVEVAPAPNEKALLACIGPA